MKAAMRAPLPVYIEDPVARLQFVRRAMDGLYFFCVIVAGVAFVLISAVIGASCGCLLT